MRDLSRMVWGNPMKYVCVILIATLVVFAACESQPAAQDDLPEEQQEEEPEQQVLEQEAGVVEDARQELLGFFDRQQTLRYTVEYQTTVQGQYLLMTQFVDTGGVRVRTDMDAQGIEMRTIYADRIAYTCMNMGSWSCFEATSDDEIPETTGVLAREEFEQDRSLAVTRTDARTVAGVVAQCFIYTMDDVRSEQCFSPEGVPVFVETSADGHTSRTQATSYELSLPANAFELPAQPGSMDDFMGGFDASAWGY